MQSASVKTGLLSTAEIAIGDTVVPNTMHATMVGRGFIHRQLKNMVDAGCKVAIVETTSEGIKQHRDKGVEYDMLVFTNLTPEHLQSHGGSFKRYKQVKMSVFKKLHKQFRKDGISKVIFANTDDEHGVDFLRHKADKNISFGINSGDIRAEEVSLKDGIEFLLRTEAGQERYHAPLVGRFNIYNALAAVLIAKEVGLTHSQIADGLASVSAVPGRMEVIDEGQNFQVFVDFAHEGVGIRNAFGAFQDIRKRGHKVIGVVGGVGGGRDHRNRFEIGKEVAKLADIVVVTTVDPYDDDPDAIIADVISATEEGELVISETLFSETDRREGIRKALSFARDGDVVIIAGKGAETTMMISGGKSMPWDEREIVREEIRHIRN